MQHLHRTTFAAFTSLALTASAWAAVDPVADTGGRYAVLSSGSLALDGSASLPSDTGTTITTYEWDLDGNDE